VSWQLLKIYNYLCMFIAFLIFYIYIIKLKTVNVVINILARPSNKKVGSNYSRLMLLVLLELVGLNKSQL